MSDQASDESAGPGQPDQPAWLDDQTWRNNDPRCLRTVDQLPDLDIDPVIVVFDEEPPMGDIILRCGEREIHREPASWEYYPDFLRIAKVLRWKYGDRLHDVIPTQRAGPGLWGDQLRAPEIIDGMRERIRLASRIENWWNSEPVPDCFWRDYDRWTHRGPDAKKVLRRMRDEQAEERKRNSASEPNRKPGEEGENTAGQDTEAP